MKVCYLTVQAPSSVSEKQFLEMVKKRHALMEIPVTITSGQRILDAFEVRSSISTHMVFSYLRKEKRTIRVYSQLLHAYDGQQIVIISVTTEVMDRFLLDIAIRRTARNIVQLSDLDVSLIFKYNRDAIKKLRDP